MRFEVDPTRVAHETIDGEAILIHMKTGFYYSLEGVGSQIWGALVDGYAPEQIVQQLGGRYDAPREAIETSVSALVDELRNEGLIDDAGIAPSSGKRAENELSGETGPACEEFEVPVLHRYTDMADFILVDPIHEVDERGWPNRVAP